MAEQTGVHDVIFHTDARIYVPSHALELIVSVLMLPRACPDHARTRANGTRWATNAFLPLQIHS